MAFMNKKLFLLVSFACLLVLFPAYANLIRNPSFESGENNRVEEWSTLVWNNGNVEFNIVEGISHSGSKALAIINNDKEMGSCSQVVDIEAGKTYRLSCWIKTEYVGTDPGARGAFLSVNTNPETSIEINGFNSEWIMVELYIVLETTNDENINNLMHNVVVHLNLGEKDRYNTGTAYFDDVELEEAAEVPGNAIIARITAVPQGNAPEKNKTPGVDPAVKEREKRTMTIMILIVVVIVLVISGRALLRIFRKSGKTSILANNRPVCCKRRSPFRAGKLHRLNSIKCRKYQRKPQGKRKTVRSKKAAGKKSLPE